MARELASRTGNERATFINTGTAASYFPNPGQSAYTMSKLAVNMLIDQLHTGEFTEPLFAFRQETDAVVYRISTAESFQCPSGYGKEQCSATGVGDLRQRHTYVPFFPSLRRLPAELLHSRTIWFSYRVSGRR